MRTTTSRPIPLALTALIAFFSALTALAVSNGHDAHAHELAPTAAITPKELALRNGMRALWEDHVTWTRLAVISLLDDAPDTNATVGRLLRNQRDIGNAIKPFYGAAAGNALTAELRKHILIAADLIAAAKAGDSANLTAAQSRWVENADGIAALLHSVNPRYWKLGAMKAEMHKHLDLTTQEAVARLQGNWAADVDAYDKVHVHILHM
ncbi:MAG TPA: hypothetical protein VNR63_03685, partial [Gaiellaceae bacterium]|nr:hypothetical protein [Gaiellaceae bacterium]